MYLHFPLIRRRIAHGFLASLLVVALGSGIALLAIKPSPAAALSGSDFQAGHIIDDAVFENDSTMSAQAIQSFLNAKVGTCDNDGTRASDHWDTSAGRYYTDGEWATLYGQSSTFTCINQFIENPSTGQNNFGRYGTSIPGGISAAQIIWDAAQQYQINPQVILVTLQKEQGLVTDYWPWYDEYQYAMGYACPDSSGCSSNYADFYQQVEDAAWQFRQYYTQPNNYDYTIGQDYINYSPANTCGGSIVTIDNQATADLYDYTPYQPDAAALAKVTSTSDGGTGDSCSSYGNRNFWWYFNDWFGSPYASYAWYVSGINVFNSPDMNAWANLADVHAGDTLYVRVTAINTGSATWYNSGANPVRMGTWDPQDRNSQFCDNSWISCSRPAVLQQSSVPPGQTGTFEFTMTVPGGQTAGHYTEGFEPVAENSAWFNGGTQISFTVEPTYITYAASDHAYTDSGRTVPVDITELLPGQTIYMTIDVLNNGNTTWTNTGSTPVRLGTWDPENQNSSFCDNSWISCSRPAVLQQSSVPPGQTGTFEFTMTVPGGQPAGNHNVQLNLVADGYSWGINTVPLSFDVGIVKPTYAWSLSAQEAYQDSDRTTSLSNNSSLTLSSGQTTYITVQALNTGNTTWTNTGSTPVRLGTWDSPDRTSAFCNESWVNCNRATTLEQSSVAPGQTGTFLFSVTAPEKTGTYHENFNLVSELKQWFTGSTTLNYTITVN